MTVSVWDAGSVSVSVAVAPMTVVAGEITVWRIVSCTVVVSNGCFVRVVVIVIVLGLAYTVVVPDSTIVLVGMLLEAGFTRGGKQRLTLRME